MGTIALEEHFASPAFLQGPGWNLAADARKAGSLMAKVFGELVDIGDGRIAAMNAAGGKMMIGLDIVFAACWMIFLLYWVLTAGSVNAAQEKKAMGGLWRVVVTVLVAVLFFESFKLPVAVYPLSLSLAAGSRAFRAIGTALTVAGLVVAVLGRRTLGANWSASDQAVIKKGHALITRGVYGHVRHPIYSGFIFMFLGNALFAGTVSALLLFLLVFMSLLFSIKREEALLTEHFPEEYPAYKKRTKALIPFVW